LKQTQSNLIFPVTDSERARATVWGLCCTDKFQICTFLFL
jgi:hypothetical protein